MKKSKKFFVSALFSVLGTIGIAGCDMGGNNSQKSDGNGSQATFNTAIHSGTFLKELRGNATSGGKAMEATLGYFSYGVGNKPFIAPKDYNRNDINWESVSVESGTYLKNIDGFMEGLVSVAVYGIFDDANSVNYVYTVKIADDGEIIQCVINSDVSEGVWNFLSDPNVKDRYLSFGVKITDLKNRVIGVTSNNDGKLNVGETSKEAQKAGFEKNWVMNARLTINADDGKVFSIVISDGRADSFE